ncbi:MAG: hypothetical protein OXU79_13425 [Gemmatimonadota bacterium]|nr:hypothetical protein [Gemmatimonadota bacterium]
MNTQVNIFGQYGRVLRSGAVLSAILDAVNRTEEITSIASDVEPFVQEYGLRAVHLRGLHRETGLVVIIKVGTSARENFWCTELHRRAPDLVPGVYAAGSRLGEIDVHWLASEAIPYGPLGNSWNGREFELMLDAGIRFYQQAKLIQDPTLQITEKAEVFVWLEGGIRRRCPGAVDVLLSQLDDQWAFILSKCGSETCFEDFHLCNGLMRDPPPEGERAVLIDIEPNRRPWILDTAYLQVLNSGDRSRPGHRDLVPRMAAKRRQAGLASLDGSDLETATKIALGWMAARQWQPERADWEPDYRQAYHEFVDDAVGV